MCTSLNNHKAFFILSKRILVISAYFEIIIDVYKADINCYILQKIYILRQGKKPIDVVQRNPEIIVALKVYYYYVSNLLNTFDCSLLTSSNSLTIGYICVIYCR